MKKIMYFAAVAAVLSLASCAKETLNEDAGTESPVFTATISAGTKTTVNATSGKVAWETTDKITISDASAAVATYKIKSIDGTTGKATFEFESGASLGQGPYTAIYGTAPATVQNYAATPCNLYMTAPGTSTNSFTFTVQCGLMEINLTKTGESVKSIAVTGTPTAESETTYTLTCTDAVSIAAKKSFYIALPEGSFNKIVITDSEGKVCTLTAASGIALENNHIKPVTLDAGKLDFIPADALAGVFTVADPDGSPNSGDETKVRFSKGNLYAKKVGETWKWDFYDEQYQFLDKDMAVSGSTSYIQRTVGADETEIDLFTWGYNEATSLLPRGKTYVIDHTTTGENQLNPSTGGDDWGVAYCNSNSITVGTWRTLTKDEWCYLFAYDPSKSKFIEGHPRRQLFKYGVTVCGKVNCLVIAPDGWNLTTHPLQSSYGTESSEGNPMTWEQAEAKGLVCLPAAGFRDGSGVYGVGDYGYYWSSTADGEYNAFSVYFYSAYVNPDLYNGRDVGSSVRLITECQ